VHYLPVYLHPYYEDLGYRAGQCPAAEEFYARAISLPIFPGLSDDDSSRVVETVTALARDLLE
jgi:perosamine synthetase